ncbi:hypothetical protein FQA39_LY14511 [Lamprigera yunnana]|nr:hypothetical protein FQA39_LY14511 [Lamprigera yunnana]
MLNEDVDVINLAGVEDLFCTFDLDGKLYKSFRLKSVQITLVFDDQIKTKLFSSIRHLAINYNKTNINVENDSPISGTHTNYHMNDVASFVAQYEEVLDINFCVVASKEELTC